MPKIGFDEGTVFLDDVRASRFVDPKVLEFEVIDDEGRAWPLMAGSRDETERNYGLFDGDRLIAFLKLISPDVTAEDCPTCFWSIARVAVLDPWMTRGIASALVGAVMLHFRAPVASHVDQTPGGAAVWKRYIRSHPGEVAIYSGSTVLGGVVWNGERFEPDPWADRCVRLVRHPPDVG